MRKLLWGGIALAIVIIAGQFYLSRGLPAFDRLNPIDRGSGDSAVAELSKTLDRALVDAQEARARATVRSKAAEVARREGEELRNRVESIEAKRKQSVPVGDLASAAKVLSDLGY